MNTERLNIRYMEGKDLDRFDALGNSEFARRYRCMYFMTKEESAEYLHQMMEKKRDFAIALKDTDELIGQIHLDNDSLRYGVNSVELAYWIGEPYTRKGYMTEALRAVMGWLFHDQGCDLITVRVLAPNTASRRLMEKLGFTQEGYLRWAMNFEGTVYDDVNFSLMKEEFAN